jgi:hemin uptake protein HemP
VKEKENKHKEIDSKDIFDKKKVIEIKHNGHSYFLKITKINKLILTK